jgi:hypothetical protein
MPEDESGYEAYVKYLYDRDVVPAASQHEKHHFHREEEFDYPLGQLARASATLKLVTAAPDLYRTFRAEALSDLLRQVAWGVERNDRVLDRLGFTDILDSEYLILAKGMRLEHLPPGEAELLRSLGFPDAADSLPGLIYLVREHAETFASRNRVLPDAETRNLRERLEKAAQDHARLGEIEEEIAALKHGNEESSAEPIRRLGEEAESKKRPRRWWKGIGQIVQGAGISLGDAAVACGLGAAGVAPAWTALVSVTLGVGTIMSGIGDLHNE